MIAHLRGLFACTRGTAVIETAIIAPVLAIMAMGTFEMGLIVQKQQELQSAASEAEAIILAAAAGSGVSGTKLKSMLASSTKIPEADITLTPKYRCGNQATLSDTASCPSGQQMYSFVQATFVGSYSPTWKKFGLGDTFSYSVTRTVQVG